MSIVRRPSKRYAPSPGLNKALLLFFENGRKDTLKICSVHFFYPRRHCCVCSWEPRYTVYFDGWGVITANTVERRDPTSYAPSPGCSTHCTTHYTALRVARASSFVFLCPTRPRYRNCGLRHVPNLAEHHRTFRWATEALWSGVWTISLRESPVAGS